MQNKNKRKDYNLISIMGIYLLNLPFSKFLNKKNYYDKKTHIFHNPIDIKFKLNYNLSRSTIPCRPKNQPTNSRVLRKVATTIINPTALDNLSSGKASHLPNEANF